MTVNGLTFADVVDAHTRTWMDYPSQVQGVLKDGRCFYFRYRWGTGSLGIGDTVDAAISDPDTVEDDYSDDPMDGVLDQQEFEAMFLRLLPRRLDLV